MSTDRIEKEILLHTTLERVWHAISGSQEFGAWLGAAFDGPFAENARLTARIVPTTVDEDIARLQKPHEGVSFAFLVDRIEPMKGYAKRNSSKNTWRCNREAKASMALADTQMPAYQA
jgi:hypothetical protein